MKKLLTLITLLAFVAFTNAQDFKFGKVSKEELQEKVRPIDSSANAAFLNKYTYIKVAQEKMKE